MARIRIHALSNSSGFTVPEVLIALAIFSFGLMAVGALQARSLMETGDVAQKTEAWTIADEQATLLKQMPFMNTATTPWSVPAQLTAGTQQVRHLNGRYDVHWTVVPNDPIGPVGAAFLPNVPPGMYTVSRRITVEVTPLGGNIPNDTIAEVQFIKTWWATGVP